MLAAASRPDHPALVEWLEEPFDPHAFDLDAINADLAGFDR